MYKYGDFPCGKKTLTWIHSFTLEKSDIQGYYFFVFLLLTSKSHFGFKICPVFTIGVFCHGLLSINASQSQMLWPKVFTLLQLTGDFTCSRSIFIFWHDALYHMVQHTDKQKGQNQFEIYTHIYTHIFTHLHIHTHIHCMYSERTRMYACEEMSQVTHSTHSTVSL